VAGREAVVPVTPLPFGQVLDDLENRPAGLLGNDRNLLSQLPASLSVAMMMAAPYPFFSTAPRIRAGRVEFIAPPVLAYRAFSSECKASISLSAITRAVSPTLAAENRRPFSPPGANPVKPWLVMS